MRLRLTGETFEVEYIYYILILLCLMACILSVVRLRGQSQLANNPMSLADGARQRKLKEEKALAKAESRKSPLSSQGRNRNPVMKRELARVPTPWGWPQYGEDGSKKNGERDFPGSLHRLADMLIHEKKTVQDQHYLEKRNASMRALLEDRYGRPSTMSNIPYRQVQAPLLRDPNAPHDQMDNFPSGKVDQLASKLKRQSGISQGRPMPSSRDAKRANLKNLKTPWGW